MCLYAYQFISIKLWNSYHKTDRGNLTAFAVDMSRQKVDIRPLDGLILNKIQ